MMVNKEFGSDFHYCDQEEYLSDVDNSQFKSRRWSLFFSGRAALYALLEQGIKTSGWKKILLPTYYCHEVEAFLKPLNIKIQYYSFIPNIINSPVIVDAADDNDTTVFVSVKYFGLIKPEVLSEKAIIFDDLTHTVDSFTTSNADYCFGSLRKEYPVPVGGFCYSPKNLILPIGETSKFANEIAVQKLSAMFLKKKYIEEGIGDKSVYRQLASEAESKFEDGLCYAAMPSVAQSILHEIDVKKMRDAKSKNIIAALSNINDHYQMTVNFNIKSRDAFGIVLQFSDAKIKKMMMSHLIENQIFPAVLWPEQFREAERLTSEKLLFVHVDYRYNTDDVIHISKIINQFFANE